MGLVVGTLRGGTERQILMSGSALVARGHAVAVTYINSASDQAAAAHDAGIRVVGAGFPGLQPSVLLKPFPEICRLRAVFRAAAPDVVHCFLYWGYLIGVPIARSVGVPVVISSRRSLTAASRRFRLLIPLDWVCDRLAEAVVCNSIAVMKDAVRHTRLPRRKTLAIRNGVFLPTVQGPSWTRPPRVVILANPIGYKGHDVGLAGFARVRVSMSALETRPQIADAGPEEGPLPARPREFGIDGDVEFLGSVADVSALLADCAFTVTAVPDGGHAERGAGEPGAWPRGHCLGGRRGTRDSGAWRECSRPARRPTGARRRHAWAARGPCSGGTPRRRGTCPCARPVRIDGWRRRR